MAYLTTVEAIWAAIRGEMRLDSRVLVMGQDVELDAADVKNEFGAQRVRSTPISECGFIGAGIGAALTGLRPIVELGCSTFLYSAMDQVVNQAAKSRYMFGGQASVPIVIRAPVFYGVSLAAHHSDRPWGLFAQSPGLKIVIPSTPRDAKGLFTAALRDGNPVLCFEDIGLSELREDVPEEDFTIPLGAADVKRQGTDVTIVALAASVHRSLAAATRLDKEKISAEVIDLRTVVPLDRETILTSIRKTGRLIAVDPAPGMCGVAAEVAALAAEHAFSSLKAPVCRITAPQIPVPFSSELERLMYPTEERIVTAARELCGAR